VRNGVSLRQVATVLVALAALAFPTLMHALGLDFYISMGGRIVVAAIAATSLNLVLGYGGMVSFGHAAFVGLGAYTTGILLSEGRLDAGTHVLATLAVTAGAALVIGAVSLRTRGVYFIMITLAFGQMLFFLCNSIKGYGGDEGLNLRVRSEIGFGLDLKDAATFYYVALAVLAATLWLLRRFVASRLGRAVAAMRDDDERAEALGFPSYRCKLAVFVAAGALGGIAGLLAVNQQGYVSPNLLHWTQSGNLMVMVILGGVATLWGGVLGALVFTLLQEGLAAYTPHWEFWTGWVLLAVVLFARRGLAGLLQGAPVGAASLAPSDERSA
jgi:branched-chain amino acid transport system permease protein